MIISAGQAQQKLKEQQEKRQLANVRNVERYVQEVINNAIEHEEGYCYIREDKVESALKTPKEVEAYLKELGYTAIYHKKNGYYKIIWAEEEIEKEKQKRKVYNRIKKFFKSCLKHKISEGIAFFIVLLITFSFIFIVSKMNGELDVKIVTGLAIILWTIFILIANGLPQKVKQIFSIIIVRAIELLYIFLIMQSSILAVFQVLAIIYGSIAINFNFIKERMRA